MTKLEAAKAALTITFFVGADLIVRRPTVLRDTITARAYARRFYPTAVFVDGCILIPPGTE